MARTELAPPPSPRTGRDRRAPAHRPRRHRARAVLAIVVLVVLVPTGWSYGRAMTAPGSAPLSARTVEWIKGHGGASFVLWAERWWYARHQPPIGGTPAGGIPQVPGAPATATSPGATQSPSVPAHLAAPPDMRPIASNPLPREGVWQTVGKTVDGLPTVRVAFLRPDRLHTSVVAGVAWIDTKLVQTVLVPGTQVPSASPWQRGWGAEVPRRLRDSLVATFNSGFLLQDSHGGFYLNGHTYAPLNPGQAAVVLYRDGTVAIGRWGRDVTMSPDVLAVRQNLSLLVNHGSPVPGLGTDSFQRWGATLGNAALVWRSGLGVTADGALVYAAGPDLSVQSLAQVLARAGAVRAMELDINTDWTSFNYYTSNARSSWGTTPHKLLSSMYRSADRYLVSDERDFFAVLLRPGLPGSR